jgi:hypothetical protein
MEDVLRSKRLYWITLGKEQDPFDAEKKSKWDNKNDEAVWTNINLHLS